MATTETLPPCVLPRPIYLHIALDVPLDRLFDYLAENVVPGDVGRRVIVPFGRRRLVGIVWAIGIVPDDPGRTIRPIEAMLDDMPALSAAQRELLTFCAAYYHHPLGQVVHTALPARLRDPAPLRQSERWFYQAPDLSALTATLAPRAVMQHRLAALLATPRDESSLRAVSASAWKLVQAWLAAGYLRKIDPLHGSIPLRGGNLLHGGIAHPAADRACLPTEEARQQGTVAGDGWATPPPAMLNGEQAAALARILERTGAAHGFDPILLYGITGSGKTEVYLQAIARVLAEGKQILVLVPEINLTPQLEARFRQRFPTLRIACLHSNVSEGVRASEWIDAARGAVRIVIGTRLALFTPMPDLGLIVVDEENDGSFKQQEGLRYHARDLAIWRAHQVQIPVVLGSATPSLESWEHSEQARYTRLMLSRRAVADAILPRIALVDTRGKPLEEGLAPATLAALGRYLARGEQSLVLLNRRGYAPALYCRQCGWVAGCPRCSARLTLHLRDRRLRCHHCGREEAIVPRCPGCGTPELIPVGYGTQRLEDALHQQFPHARIARVDRDSMQRKGSFMRMTDAVRAGQTDILIGTQMLAKGHDFPNLTLVVVLGADQGLHSADFRATERLMALLVQVAGRAGRGARAGEVLIQTDHPDHPIYPALVEHDYPRFAGQTLAERRLYGFPPYAYQALLLAEADQMADALAFLTAAIALAPNDPQVRMWDPVPTAMPRLASRERAQLLLQSPQRTRLHGLLRAWMPQLRALPARKVRWVLEVDPQEV